METISTASVIIAIITLLVLIIGITVMAIGGKTSAKYSNKLMTLRVILQACVIGFLMISYFLFKNKQ